MIVYKKGLGYHHKRVYKQVSERNGHSYKMYSGSGVTDSITELSKPIIDFVSNNRDTLKHIGETAINTVKIGQNTRQIVNTIKNDYKHRNLTASENLAYEHKDLKDIIKRISKLKTTGSGFAYT